MAGCPSHETLDRFVGSGEPDGDVRNHCADCAACRERVAELRADAAFVARFRAAGVLDTPPAADWAEPPPESPQPDAAPHRDLLKGYQIFEEIHRGGQGVVYRAVQIPTQRTVALKMLLAGRSATDREKQRFEREARIAAGLRHPNIVTVYDGGFLADGRYAFAMEYIEGQPLDSWSAQLDQARTRDARRRALRERLRVMAKVCDAVLCAHQHAIIHRDLKPANIMVDSEDEPHVVDFGIARDMGPEERTRLTHPGGFAGTLAYASPEQVSGDPSRVDTRTDIYSLGVILYEMVSGRMPYAVDGPVAQAIRNIEKAEPAPLLRRTADSDGPFVDGEVSTIILKAMAKDPARRYQTAAGLGKDINRYLAGEAIEARRDSTWYVLRKAAARHRLALSGAVLVFLLLAVFGAAMAWQAHRVEVRGRELAVALSNGNIERGRALVQVGNMPEAESLLWAQLLDAPPGVDRWDPDDGRLPRSRAWWALWELYAANPCAATVRTSEPIGPAGVGLLLPVPGHDDLLLVADTAGAMGLRTLPDLALGARSTTPADSEQEGRPPALCAGAFTADGALLTVADDNTIRRWDAATLEPLGRPFSLTSLAPGNYPYISISADGTRLAIPDSSVIRLFDVSSGTLLETIPLTPNERARSLLLSADGKWLAFAEREGITVRHIGPPRTANYARMEANFELRSMAFTNGDGGGAPRLFFTAGSSVLILDAAHAGEAQRFADLENVSSLCRIALSGDGRWLAVASVDRRISLWDARGSSGVLALPYIAAHDSVVMALTFRPDGRSLLSGHDDGVVQRWDLSDLSSTRRGAFVPLHGHNDSVFALAIGATAAGMRGYSSAYDRTVRAWDLESGQETGCSNPLDGQVESIALSADGRTIAAAIDLGDHADVIFLDTGTLHSQVRIENAHAIRCADLAFSPDGGSLATVGQGGFVRLWSTTTMEAKAHHRLRNPRNDKAPDPSLHTVQFSPDGRTLGWGGECGVVNLADPSLIAPRDLPGNTQTVRCLRFSPDGRRVAAAGNNSTIWIWDTATGRPIHEMKGHVGATYAVAFSPDGRMLASSGSDGTVRLWDAATGNNLAILRDRPAEYDKGLTIFAVQFTPDGDQLFVGGKNGYLGVWDLRHYDRHIAGNLEYQLDQLNDGGRPSPMAGAARRWAERNKHPPENGK